MFKPDGPIDSAKEDLLGRSSFASSLAEAILSYEHKDSAVTAMYGGWGSGKSSVVNMVVESVEEKAKSLPDNQKPVVIFFNPWNYSDQDHLITQFFRELSIALNRKDYGEDAKKVGEQLETYSEFFKPLALIPEPTGFAFILSTLMAKLCKLFGVAASRWASIKSKDLAGIRKELDALLSKQSRKIIIVIDDIDRLKNSEIRQVFQLVKMLGNFPNTVYFLAFDRVVVVNALKKVQEGDGEEYLEKIVQIPFELPKISSQEVEQLLFKQLDEILVDIEEEKFDRTSWGNIYQGGLRRFFTNLRDVIRYANTVRFGFSMIKDDVNPVDFLAISAFQVFEPSVYAGLRDNEDLFTGIIGRGYGNDKTYKESIKNRCDEILKRVVSLDEDILLKLFKRLFPKLESVYGNYYYGDHSIRGWRRERRVCSSEHFDTYFSLSVPKGEISQAEIENILKLAGDEEAFSKTLLSLSKDGKVLHVLDRMEDYTAETIPESHIASIINVLMDIGDLLPEAPRGMYSLDTPAHIMRLMYQLSERIKNQDERFKLYKEAIIAAQKSLHTIVHEVVVHGQHHGKLSSTPEEGLEPEEERPVSSEHLIELEQLAYEKIKQWAEDGRLGDHLRLIPILYQWKRWAKEGEKEVTAYIDNLIKSDAGLTKLIKAFVSQSVSHTITDEVGRINSYIDLKTVNDFIHVEKIEPMVRSIIEADSFKDLDEEQQKALKLFIDTVDGKVDDRRR